MFNFKEDKTYTFGELAPNFDHTNAGAPKWKRGAFRPIVLSGAYLLENEIADFEQFLRSPEFCPFPNSMTIACYTEDIKSGRTDWVYCGRGNPQKPPKQNNMQGNGNQGLADGSMNAMLLRQMSNPSGASNYDKATIKLFQDQIKVLNENNTSLMLEISELRSKLTESEINNSKTISELQAENHKLSIENETLKGITERFDGSQQSSGLADLASNLSNPALMQGIATIIQAGVTAFAAFKGSKNGAPQDDDKPIGETMQLQGQQAQQTQQTAPQPYMSGGW